MHTKRYYDGAISMTKSGTRHETYDLWATPEEFDHLMKLQFVAIKPLSEVSSTWFATTVMV